MAFDFEVIAKARAGDEEAFAALVKLHMPYIYRTAFAFLHRREEAEDVAQEVCLKLYRSLPQLKEIQAFPSWFKQLITRTCLDHLKKSEPVLLADTEVMGASIPGVEEEVERRILVREAIRRLSQEHRRVLVLREWQGYDYQDIANMLGVPVGTVKSRLHAAREQLKTILNPGGQREGWIKAGGKAL